MLENEITKINLRTMVMGFYTKVLEDEEVGPFFIQRLGHDLTETVWGEHLDLLTDFLASFTLGDINYRGNPFGPHVDMQGLSKETFSQWLILFHDTIDSIYEPNVGEQLKQRSSIIAQNFMRNLGL